MAAKEFGYPWLKLATNILDDTKIKFIRKQPDGDALFVMWVGLLCLGMKCCSGGQIYVSQNVPYDAVALGDELRIEPRVVEYGIKLFHTLEMIEVYDDGSILIKNWNKHQTVDELEHRKQMAANKQKRYRERKRLEKLAEETDTESEREVEPEPEGLRNGDVTFSPDLFDLFWEAYPKKRAKTQARKTWDKISPSADLTEVIVDSVEQHKKTKDWQKEGGQYIPYPSTFLNQGGWEDELEPEREDFFSRHR